MKNLDCKLFKKNSKRSKLKNFEIKKQVFKNFSKKIKQETGIIKHCELIVYDC